MKDFYRESETNGEQYETIEEYRTIKRNRVLEVIKPICEAFEIEDYDYILNEQQERLRVEDTYIGCCCNNIGAIVNELIAYIFIEHYASNRDCGKFHNQTIKHLKQYWIKEN